MLSFIDMKNRIKTLLNVDTLLIFILGIVAGGLYIGTRGQILSGSTLESIGYQLPVLGLLTIAQMVAMINAGIDLSIISIANFAGITAAILLKNFSVPVIIAILLALVAAVTFGIINGIIIGCLDAPPLLVTLATGFLVRGIALGWTRGYIISGLPSAFVALGTSSVFFVPISFLIFIGISLGFSILLYYTVTGKEIFLTGTNPVASVFSGVSVPHTRVKVYLISALISGIAGLIMAARFNAAQADYGGAFLLVTVLICVLGGVSPSGGTGRVETVLIALATLQLVSTGFNVMRVSSYLASALWGGILLTVLLMSRILPKRQIM
ncbi:MAG: ABC transporter permease [Candidatus Bathyarchaeia archaeon]